MSPDYKAREDNVKQATGVMMSVLREYTAAKLRLANARTKAQQAEAQTAMKMAAESLATARSKYTADKSYDAQVEAERLRQDSKSTAKEDFDLQKEKFEHFSGLSPENRKLWLTLAGQDLPEEDNVAKATRVAEQADISFLDAFELVETGKREPAKPETTFEKELGEHNAELRYATNLQNLIRGRTGEIISLKDVLALARGKEPGETEEERLAWYLGLSPEDRKSFLEMNRAAEGLGEEPLDRAALAKKELEDTIALTRELVAEKVFKKSDGTPYSFDELFLILRGEGAPESITAEVQQKMAAVQEVMKVTDEDFPTTWKMLFGGGGASGVGSTSRGGYRSMVSGSGGKGSEPFDDDEIWLRYGNAGPLSKAFLSDPMLNHLGARINLTGLTSDSGLLSDLSAALRDRNYEGFRKLLSENDLEDKFYEKALTRDSKFHLLENAADSQSVLDKVIRGLEDEGLVEEATELSRIRGELIDEVAAYVEDENRILPHRYLVLPDEFGKGMSDEEKKTYLNSLFYTGMHNVAGSRQYEQFSGDKLLEFLTERFKAISRNPSIPEGERIHRLFQFATSHILGSWSDDRDSRQISAKYQLMGDLIALRSYLNTVKDNPDVDTGRFNWIAQRAYRLAGGEWKSQLTELDAIIKSVKENYIRNTGGMSLEPGELAFVEGRLGEEMFPSIGNRHHVNLGIINGTIEALENQFQNFFAQQLDPQLLKLIPSVESYLIGELDNEYRHVDQESRDSEKRREESRRIAQRRQGREVGRIASQSMGMWRKEAKLKKVMAAFLNTENNTNKDGSGHGLDEFKRVIDDYIVRRNEDPGAALIFDPFDYSLTDDEVNEARRYYFDQVPNSELTRPGWSAQVGEGQGDEVEATSPKTGQTPAPEATPSAQRTPGTRPIRAGPGRLDIEKTRTSLYYGLANLVGTESGKRFATIQDSVATANYNIDSQVLNQVITSEQAKELKDSFKRMADFETRLLEWLNEHINHFGSLKKGLESPSVHTVYVGALTVTDSEKAIVIGSLKERLEDN